MYQMRSYRWRRVPRVVARLFPVFRYLERQRCRHGELPAAARISYSVRIEVRADDGMELAQLFPESAS